MIFLNMKKISTTEEQFLEINASPLQRFIQNENYLKQIFAAFKNGNFATWNWNLYFMSFFGFGMFWFIYKRLYLFAFSYVIILKISAYIFLIFFRSQKYIDFIYYMFIVNILLSVIFGLYGNALHLLWIEKWKIKNNTNYFPKNSDLFTPFVILISFMFAFVDFIKTSTIFFDIFLGIILFTAHQYYFEYPLKKKRM